MSEQAPRLVPVGAAHAPALAAVHAEAFDQPWSAAELAALIEAPGAFTLAVLAPDGAPVGFVLGRALGGEGEIITLAVSRAARRRGLGRALVEAACAAARAADAELLWLEAAEDNPAALALYRAAGFEPAGRRPRYYARAGETRVDALVLRRVLNSAPP